MRSCGRAESQIFFQEMLLATSLAGGGRPACRERDVASYISTRKLSSQQPHHPARQQRSAQKHYKAIRAIANHVARVLAVSDSEHNRCEQCEYGRGAEVIERNSHC